MEWESGVALWINSCKKLIKRKNSPQELLWWNMERERISWKSLRSSPLPIKNCSLRWWSCQATFCREAYTISITDFPRSVASAERLWYISWYQTARISPASWEPLLKYFVCWWKRKEKLQKQGRCMPFKRIFGMIKKIFYFMSLKHSSNNHIVICLSA